MNHPSTNHPLRSSPSQVSREDSAATVQGLQGSAPSQTLAGHAPLAHAETGQLPARRPRGRPRKNPDPLSLGHGSGLQSAYAKLPTLRKGSKAEKRRRRGTLRRAKPLNPEAIQRALDQIELQSRSPESDVLKFWLSLLAGMRAGEIADLPIAAMLDARGEIADNIEIYASKTKKTRYVRMHEKIENALEALRRRYPEATHVAFTVRADGTLRRQSAANLNNWFPRLYRAAGLIGCTGHSGRRTFATAIAKRLGENGCSIKDLQEALGHACLSSTECYLEPSGQFDELVRSLKF